MYLVNAQQMREIDRFAMKEIGIPGIILMEAAGQAVVKEVEARWATPNARVVVLAGHGNNGGDAFVVSRHLLNKGYRVQTWLVGTEEKMSTDAATTYRALIGSQYAVKLFGNSSWEEFIQDLQWATLIVDGLLGTGVQGPLREPIGRIIEEVNQQEQADVISIDIPSGVNADTGSVETNAVEADATVTFAYPKWGQYLFPGAAYCGELLVRDISIPGWVGEKLAPTDQLLDEKMMTSLLPKRSRHSHKGTFGHVLILGGCHSYVGAPALASMGAIRSGAGMVTLAIPRTIQPMVAGKVTEAIYWLWPETEGYFSKNSWKLLTERKGRFDFTIVGPGMGQAPGSEWLEQVIRHTTGPLLLDADALNLLAKDLSMLKGREQVVLTPHPGEMARLAGVSVEQVETNRPHIARQFAVHHQVYVVLKGTYTIIATPKGEIFVSPRGSSSLAKGGSGDVLSGMIGSFVNQTGNILSGILLGVYLHGMSGEFMDEYSGAATDLGNWIGKAVKDLTADNA
ncbi:NAD(P)H-hydrate dehydratase [Ammoniphilus sp. CFH 90114]|uniref:NAD(P)H-hydrate dehydratase n=1 Tax=Ammoniphilus sp. CFH 90114 TaxID=2493665 RepID=UPI00100F73E1|nr:NAD(P)H-hydrate dehydratase [Ammoniphilus sp. CFH 90114]RXT05203.1 NAD(P)H-hydrate dehydratase [Ammoniphilus sp. CFH 90114]